MSPLILSLTDSLLHLETLVQSMAKNLEKKLNISGKKPPGGVKLFAVQSKEDAKTNHPTKKLQVLVLISKPKKVAGSSLLIVLPNSTDLVRN